MVIEGFKIEKQYELSMDVMALSKKSGWTNIVHVTNGQNCCEKGTFHFKRSQFNFSKKRVGGSAREKRRAKSHWEKLPKIEAQNK